MVIVDASVWIDYLYDKVNPETEWLDSAIGRVRIGLASLSLCEILQGVRYDRKFRGFREDLLRFPIFETWSAQLAIASAQNFRILRDRGVTARGAIDCLLATFCIEFGHSLLHRDRDFDAFEQQSWA